MTQDLERLREITTNGYIWSKEECLEAIDEIEKLRNSQIENLSDSELNARWNRLASDSNLVTVDRIGNVTRMIR